MASMYAGAAGFVTRRIIQITALTIGMLLSPSLWAVTVSVTDKAGNAVSGFRWVVEEDITYKQPLDAWIQPGDANASQVHSFNFYKSHMPVKATGHSDTSTATLTLEGGLDLDPSKHYYVSVLPDDATDNPGHAMSGRPVPAGETGTVTVVVPNTPLPAAQVFVFAFHDNNPINDQHDGANDPADEPGLGGFMVRLDDGVDDVKQDVFGNMIGTVYDTDASGNPIFDADGNPVVVCKGDGFVKTVAAADVPRDNTKGSARWCRNPYNLAVGEAKIKNLHPHKYGIAIIPPTGSDWQQTTTIEGKPTNDVWIKANEPPYFAENGAGVWHSVHGFVRPFNNIPAGGTATVSGRIVDMRMSRPPEMQFYPGEPLANCWIGLNTSLANGANGTGIYAAPCNDDSTFAIPNVPPGRYEVVVWDRYLNNIFANQIIEVAGGDVALGDFPVFRWFSLNKHTVFYDANNNGIRDEGEAGIPEQNINIRFRDGSIEQAMATDVNGEAPLERIFPWFFWEVAEVDFARYKATGGTFTVDAGGQMDTTGPAAGMFRAQIQADGTLQRTELSEPGVPVLLEGFQSFLGTTMLFDWGKKQYDPGENGGITGIVHYATTRAENDPRFAGAEDWEPGIPRVQVCLYEDDGTGKIKDQNGNGTIDRCVGDNPGDAVNVVHTDSWDDNLPSGCPAGNMPNADQDIFYQNGKCYDGLRNFNQIRPALFDGGFGFFTYFPGGMGSGSAETPLPAGKYIVEAVAPYGYLHQREQDKNVDFGESYIPTKQLVAPACVGGDNVVPPELELFPGVPSVYANQTRPLCDMKAVLLSDRQNAAVDFFMFTETPITGHIQGFVLNDLANEFDINSPNFGEKQSMPFLPISVRDWTGTEVNRVYTDQYGSYNGLVPANFTSNRPSPSGYSSSMVNVCVNDPGPIRDANGQLVTDPHFSRQYTQFCYTLNFEAGRVTFADTPVLPISAFAQLNETPVDGDLPTGTPVLFSVNSGNNNGPYLPAGSNTLTIVSVGNVDVPNPAYVPGSNAAPRYISRDYGFGAAVGSVTLNGVAMNIVAWDNTSITAQLKPNTTYTTGQLKVTRGDTQLATVMGVTVTIPSATDTYAVVQKQPNETIQQAIDRAQAAGGNPNGNNPTFQNALVLIPPGNYDEMVIMNKNIRLQGWGAGSTVINATLSRTEKIQEWRQTMSRLLSSVTPLDGQTDPLVDNEAFLGSEGAPIFVIPLNAGNTGGSNGGFAANINPNKRPRIDGFTLIGGAQAEGVAVNAYARGLEISNNRVINNQGIYGGGIRLGLPTTINPAFTNLANTDVSIHDNQVCENGAVNSEGGGIVLYGGSNRYRINNNWICANFAAGNGGGIAHVGLSNNGRIDSNKILFNQAFNQTIGGGGSGAGILVAGLTPTATATEAGAGNVVIYDNLIQGNNAGSGDGAGIAARFVNGNEMFGGGNNTTNKNNWYKLQVFNNMIVNNVAGLAGGGIALQDTTHAYIYHNTIANNDSTATAGNAFISSPTCDATANQSCPQVAGVAVYANSPALTSRGVGATAHLPELRNNIIWHNRSFYYVQTPSPGGVPGSQLIGHLVPDIGAGEAPVYNDLGVIGAAGQLNPLNGVLTTLSPSLGVNYDGTNTTADPNFMTPYVNGAPGLTMLQPEFKTSLTPRAALDEGGNYIDVRYGPLTPYGNYHVALPSAAVERGRLANNSTYFPSLSNGDRNAAFNLLTRDYDNQVRPECTYPDAGADEAIGGCSALTSSADTATTTAGVAVVINVLANDSSAGGTLQVVTVTNPSSAGGAVSINSTSTVLYTPPANWTGIDTFYYTASNGVTTSAATLVTVTVNPAVVTAAVNAVGTGSTTTTNSPSTGNTAGAAVNYGGAAVPVAVSPVTGAGGPLANSGTVSSTSSSTIASGAVAGGTSVAASQAVPAPAASEPKTVVAKAEPATAPGAVTGPLSVVKQDKLVLRERNTKGQYLLHAPGVLANDTLPKDRKVRPVIVKNVAKGRVHLNLDGSLVYTPPKGGAPKGAQTFTYRIVDGNAKSETVTVSITLDPKAEQPGAAKAGKPKAPAAKPAPAKPDATSQAPSKARPSVAAEAVHSNANVN